MTGRICGTGFCVPEHVMDNEELSRMVETSDEWIRERTGIEWNSFLRQPYLPM